MLRRLLAACAVLVVGAALFYVGSTVIPWVLSHPGIWPQLPSVGGVPTTRSTPEPPKAPVATPTASRTATRPATMVTPSLTPATRPGMPVAPAVTFTTIPAATYTPIPTYTPAPTASYAPVATSQRTVTPTALSVAAPVLIEPPANETFKGRVTFSWKSIELPPGAAYEVVWWRKDADPSTARGLAKPSTNTSQSIDLSASSLGLPTGQPLYWTVLVVRETPTYQRLSTPQVANGRLFVFQSSDDRVPSRAPWEALWRHPYQVVCDASAGGERFMVDHVRLCGICVDISCIPHRLCIPLFVVHAGRMYNHQPEGMLI